MELKKINVRVNRNPGSKTTSVFINLNTIKWHETDSGNTIKTADGYKITDKKILTYHLVSDKYQKERFLKENDPDWFIHHATGRLDFDFDPELTKQLTDWNQSSTTILEDINSIHEMGSQNRNVKPHSFDLGNSTMNIVKTVDKKGGA